MRTIERVQRTFNPRLELQGVVLTMYDRRNNLCDLVAADVREHFGDKVYDTVIPRNVRVSEAPSHGKPVLIYDHRCAGAAGLYPARRRIVAPRLRLACRNERSGQAAPARPRPRRFVRRGRDRCDTGHWRSTARSDRADPARDDCSRAGISPRPSSRRSPSRSAKRAYCSRCWCVLSLQDDAAFELVAGERRWRAAQRVGLHEVPVIVRVLADHEVLEIALVENLQREDLSPLEEAEAYSRLIAEFGRTQASLAEAVGKSRSHIANTVRLLSLPAPVRQRLDEGDLSAGHARALLAAADPGALADEVVRRGLNVRATERLVQRRAQPTQGRRPRVRDADTLALERDLGAHLGLRVTIEPKVRGGALTLHYASLDQLDQVLRLLRAG